MYRFSRIFRFEAAHRLDYLPEDHKCFRLHGHSYTVIVTLEAAELNGDGFVLEAEKMEPFGKWIDETLDHQYLNDALGDSRLTTCESLSRLLCEKAREMLPAYVQSVRVHETPRHYAEFGA